MNPQKKGPADSSYYGELVAPALTGDHLGQLSPQGGRPWRDGLPPAWESPRVAVDPDPARQVVSTPIKQPAFPRWALYAETSSLARKS